jgi:hypothetical protein
MTRMHLPLFQNNVDLPISILIVTILIPIFEKTLLFLPQSEEFQVNQRHFIVISPSDHVRSAIVGVESLISISNISLSTTIQAFFSLTVDNSQSNLMAPPFA